MRIISKVSAYKTLGLWNECWKILREQTGVANKEYDGWVNSSKYNEGAKQIIGTIKYEKSKEKNRRLIHFFERLENESPLELSQIYNKLHVLKTNWDNDTHKKKGKISEGMSRQF